MNLFSTKLKDFLDKAIEFHPVGSEFYINIESVQPCPFTIRDLADQVRAVYGSLNNYINFTDIRNPDSITESSVDLRREALPWIKHFLMDQNRLDSGQVPAEVLHWLRQYRGRHQELMDYLNRT